MKSTFLKGTLVVLFASIVSTIGIFASDTLRGIDGGVANIGGSGGGTCRAGMVAQKIDDALICVDMYEASPSSQCPNPIPLNALESEKNALTPECYAVSVVQQIPWVFVTLSQAQRMCAEAGKRLPTSDEWYKIALGTDSSQCVINSRSPLKTGTPACVASSGAFDMVGNVWEWVDETVDGNQFKERPLPEEGYVTSADASGVAITTDTNTGDLLYGEDYFWSKSEGIFGMIRGGFYGSADDAGLYTVNATVATNFAAQGVGFRCVEDVI